MRSPFRNPRTLRVLDVAVAAWVIVWIALGVTIGIKMRDLTVLGRTVAHDGRAVQSIGASLRGLAGLPLIGSQIGIDGAQAEQAGARTVAGAAAADSAMSTLSVLLAIAIALLPSIPVLLLYVPMRLGRRRDAAQLRRALRAHGADPRLHALLAHRALSTLTYESLHAMLDGPSSSGPDGRRDYELAMAELRRLGIDTRLLRPPAHHET